MTTPLRTILAECAVALLDSNKHIKVEDVVNCAYRDHPEAFTDATHRLVMTAARREVRDILTDLVGDDDHPQLALPGLDFPSAICVRVQGRSTYVRTDKATWSDLEAGEVERDDNVARALAKRDRYHLSKERLRPWMETHPKITVAKALRAEADAQAKAS